MLAAKNVLLEEKTVLARELQHRVRNNLQLVYGMLGKQAQITSDEVSIDGFATALKTWSVNSILALN